MSEKRITSILACRGPYCFELYYNSIGELDMPLLSSVGGDWEVRFDSDLWPIAKSKPYAIRSRLLVA